MAIERAKYRVYNGTNFDEIHFKTSADLVEIKDTAGKFTATEVEGALKENADKIGNLNGIIGSLSSLVTTVKTSIVNAINEIKNELTSHKAETTQAHGGIVSSTDSRLSDARTPLSHGNEKHSANYITAAQAPVQSVAGKTGTVTLSKADVGLGNVDNVKQIPYSTRGVANGVATLDSNGKLSESQIPVFKETLMLPSDEVIYQDATEHTTPSTTGIEVATVSLVHGGSYRIKAQLRNHNSTTHTRLSVMLNEVELGVGEVRTSSYTSVVFEVGNVPKASVLRFFLKTSNNSYNAYAKNIAVCGSLSEI